MKLEALFSLACLFGELVEERFCNAVNSRGCNLRHGEDA